MEIEIFTICDHAKNFGGQLVVVGTFDLIRSKSFPIIHPHCSIALRMRFAESEVGSHSIQLKLLDDGGNELQSINGDLEVPKPLYGINYSAINTVLNFGNLPFNLPGRYSFELHVDGEWQRGLSIYVLLDNKQLKAA